MGKVFILLGFIMGAMFLVASAKPSLGGVTEEDPPVWIEGFFCQTIDDQTVSFSGTVKVDGGVPGDPIQVQILLGGDDYYTYSDPTTGNFNLVVSFSGTNSAGVIAGPYQDMYFSDEVYCLVR